MNEQHGIIQVGRNYADGSGRRATTHAQDRRIVQEIFRFLAQFIPGVDTDMLLLTLKNGLAEDGFDSDDMRNLLRFFDGLVVRVAGQHRPLRVGDRVTCPSGKAQGISFDSIIGVGIIDHIDNDRSIKVSWPAGDDWWNHYESELVLADAVQLRQVGSLAGSGLTPSIIGVLRRKQEAGDNGYISSTTYEDRLLVKALLDDARLRDTLFNFGNNWDDAREAVSRVINDDTIGSEEVTGLLALYEDVTDPQAAVKRQKRAELERLRSQVAELERDLAA